MAQTILIDPITRIEGHLKVQVTVDLVQGKQQVVDVSVGGTMFRGFEKILVTRSPLDAPDISERICGVCPISQGLAATLALEAAANIVIPDNARIMRNLVLAADTLHSHIMHFYTLALLDFVAGPAMPPWQPTLTADQRIFGSLATTLVQHYTQALDQRRQCHEMGALFAGRLPHSPAFIPGGFTTTPRQARITSFATYLTGIQSFIQNVYIPDVNSIANAYGDYYQQGAGPKNLLAFGVFDLDNTGLNKLQKRGVALNAATTPSAIDFGSVAERVTSSFYDNSTDNLNPANGSTVPVNPKTGAYSWLKGPRYQGLACQVGPLARMWVNGDYQSGISVMDRHVARALEANKIVQQLGTWLNELVPSGPVYQQFTIPASGSAMGLTEAARGALGHWVSYSNSAISNYQIVSPTCWNASPSDSSGVRGAMEQALIGTPVADATQPIEIARVIHSFDPCLGCAVHVTRPGENKRVFNLGLPYAR